VPSGPRPSDYGAFLYADDHSAFGSGLSNVAPLRVAGENDVRVIGPNGVIVDMA
jgi:hypothetical protein